MNEARFECSQCGKQFRADANPGSHGEQCCDRCGGLGKPVNTNAASIIGVKTVPIVAGGQGEVEL